MTILEANGLTKRFGKHLAVDHVSMTIGQGDIYGFIGKNGAGKTTFMRMALGTAFPTEGTISLMGGIPLGEARRRIGSLVEKPGLYPYATARENLIRFSILAGADAADVERLLELVGLADTGNKKVRDFSLGMKQRLGVAVALVGRPGFIVLDEPVNGLDPTGIRDVRDLILRLNREEGVTFLISSHLLDELAKVVTRYGIINDGRMVEEITAAELARKCESRLRVSVDDPARAAAALSGFAPAEVGDGAVFLASRVEEGAAVNRLLTEAGLSVSGITVESRGMEEYFVERIGG